MLLGNGDGTFQTPGSRRDLPRLRRAIPVAIVAGDFTNNGILDLATADANGIGTDDYSVYLGNGDGTFQAPTPYRARWSRGLRPPSSTGDFTGNGRTDLAITRTSPDDVQVQLSNGDGTFSNPSVVDLVRRETPLVADLNGDGAPDVSVVDAAGDILYRAGRPGEPGSFAPPVTVNPGDPSRDIAVRHDPVRSRRSPVSTPTTTRSRSSSCASNGFVLVAKLATGSEPAQILAADLDGNGMTDLIVRNAGDGTISVFAGNGHGWFLPPVDLPVGLGASDIEVADLQQDGRLDIVYTDRISGEVGVLENLGGGSFRLPRALSRRPGPVRRHRDGRPIAGLEPRGNHERRRRHIHARRSSLAGRARPGLEHLRPAHGPGRRRPLPTRPTSPTPATGLVVRAVDFNGNGLSGLAVLTPDGLFIYVSDGQGGFLPPTEYNVGFEPNGLTVADLNGNGKADLLVSNPLGDVQVLIGNGDGTFQPVQNLDQQVGAGGLRPERNARRPRSSSPIRLTDQLIVQTVGGVTTVLGDASTGLISPGAVALADLNNNGILDLIVANSGSNNVLVYPGWGMEHSVRRSTTATASSPAPTPRASPSPTSPATAGST